MKGYRPYRRKGPKESSIDEKVKEYGQERGGKSVKLTMLNQYGSAGWPDRFWMFPDGLCFFMEMKRPGKTSTPIQKETQKLIANLGFRVYRDVDSVEQGKSIIDAELAGKPKGYLRRAA